MDDIVRHTHMRVEQLREWLEIERLRADKAAISQTASDYLHKIEKLEALLKPFLDTAKSEGIVT